MIQFVFERGTIYRRAWDQEGNKDLRVLIEITAEAANVVQALTDNLIECSAALKRRRHAGWGQWVSAVKATSSCQQLEIALNIAIKIL